MAHLSQFLKVPWLRVFTTCGGWAVPIFFFVSGYGLYYSLEHKNSYLKGFLYKRLGKILIPFLMSSLLYVWLFWYNGCDLHSRYFSWYGISLFTLPYSWFVQSIIVFYVLFYISNLLFRNRFKSILFILISVIFYEAYRWYIGCVPNSFFAGICFPMGMILCWKETEIELFLKRLKTYYFILVIVGFTLVALVTYDSFGKIYAAIMFYLLTRFVSKGNILLELIHKSIDKSKLSRISYEVYLSQGIAFLALKSKIVNLSSPFYYSIACVLICVAISGGVYLVTKQLNKILNI